MAAPPLPVPDAAPAPRWTHVNYALGLLPANFNVDASFPIPASVVPKSAAEILVFASVCCLPSAPDTAGRYEISAAVDRLGNRAAFFLVLKPYAGTQRNSNSDNVWLPMPPDRTLLVRLGAYPSYPATNLSGHILSALRLVAYREAS